MLIVLTIEKDTFLLVKVYHVPGFLGFFMAELILLINELPARHRKLTVGDFNLDKMLPEHVAIVDPLIQNFNLSQCYNIQLIYKGEYWIWYLITLFFFSKSVLIS